MRCLWCWCDDDDKYFSEEISSAEFSHDKAILANAIIICTQQPVKEFFFYFLAFLTVWIICNCNLKLTSGQWRTLFCSPYIGSALPFCQVTFDCFHGQHNHINWWKYSTLSLFQCKFYPSLTYLPWDKQKSTFKVPDHFGERRYQLLYNGGGWK